MRLCITPYNFFDRKVSFWMNCHLLTIIWQILLEGVRYIQARMIALLFKVECTATTNRCLFIWSYLKWCLSNTVKNIQVLHCQKVDKFIWFLYFSERMSGQSDDRYHRYFAWMKWQQKDVINKSIQLTFISYVI